MKRNVYALPAAGSAAVTVSATQASRLVNVAENTNTPQGILLFFAQDNYTQGYTVTPAREPYKIGNEVARGRGRGPWVGLPVQMDQGGTVTLRPATVLFKATSATGTATSIAVEEWD